MTSKNLKNIIKNIVSKTFEKEYEFPFFGKEPTTEELKNILLKKLSPIATQINIMRDDKIISSFKIKIDTLEIGKLIEIVNKKLKELSKHIKGNLSLVELNANENYMIIRYFKKNF